MRSKPQAVTLVALVTSALSSAAFADPTTPADHTFYGITPYALLDIGFAHASHSAPRSDNWAQGLNYGISANSNGGISAMAANGLSQTRFGARGAWPVADDLNVIATLESRLNPLSLNFPNGAKSLVQANRVAPAQQQSNGTSSQAGQLFSAQAFAGVRSVALGTLTAGYQNGLLYDQVLAYDPQAGSYAFSLVGFSALAAGGGISEYNRLNNSLKYQQDFSLAPIHVGAQVAPGGSQWGGTAGQFDLGGEWQGWHADLVYAFKRDGIALSSYNGITSSQLRTLTQEGLTPADALVGTIADTRATALLVRYQTGPSTLFAAVENIVYSTPDAGNPANQIGAATLGGYYLGTVKATNYTRPRVMEVSWAGATVQASDALQVTAAFYRYQQNNYATSSTCTSNCAGHERAWSLSADYRLNAQWDVYAGLFKSEVDGGLAYGFLNGANLTTMTGVRLRY